MSTVPSKFSHRRLARFQTNLSVHPNPAERAADLSGLLQQTHQLLVTAQGDSQQVGVALDGLFGGLCEQKRHCTEEEWQDAIRQCRNHPLREVIHQDPFTYRAFAKPRGYAGDAELLDLIYTPEERWPEPEASPLGLDIYRYTVAAPAAEGVRARRGFVADLIDETAAASTSKHILAIAAGHLREANLTSAIRRRKFGRFVALDADAASIAEVERSYGPFGVEAVPSPFSHLVTGRLQLGQFDLIYSTGLFDYLSNSTGRRLVSTLFEMLNPGGELVVANFLPGIRDVGFMEAFMDWQLIYRTRHDMIDLTMEIPESEIRDCRIFAEESRNIIFIRMTKR
jgi:SAM-dependent methyltransferase